MRAHNASLLKALIILLIAVLIFPITPDRALTVRADADPWWNTAWAYRI